MAASALVPAHTGGADLSWPGSVPSGLGAVPAHTGGADLSLHILYPEASMAVPAHTGGADLSLSPRVTPGRRDSPRPHGRGGFK